MYFFLHLLHYVFGWHAQVKKLYCQLLAIKYYIITACINFSNSSIYRSVNNFHMVLNLFQLKFHTIRQQFLNLLNS